ncbi:MAG TPA: HEAT repeat domain-containing protein, partial [Anaerolineales bacterium]|nr:HEAT repeat domain-containing protein [Anaerolineales bacterium]
MTGKTLNIPKLKQALESEDASIRFNAGLDLVKAGDPAGVPALIEAFEHSSSVLRTFHAGQALVALGKPAVPALLDALEAEGIQTRVDAAITLAQIDSSYLEKVFPIVEEGLRSDNSEASYDAVQFIGRHAKEHAAKVVPFLLDVLRTPTEVADPQAWIENKRGLVAGLLSVIGEPREAIVKALIENLTDEQVGVRWSAAV